MVFSCEKSQCLIAHLRKLKFVKVAVTHLTLIAVQKALNAIVKVLKDVLGTSLAGVL